MSKSKREIPVLLPELKNINVELYIQMFLEENKASEDAVQTVFNDYTNDKDFTSVFIKIIVLNNRYSAGLHDNISTKSKTVDVVTMSDHIVKKQTDIQKAIKANDKIALVNILKNVGGKYNASYSFATKYCAWKYPQMNIYIVDGFTKGLLYYYNEKLTPPIHKNLKQAELNNYETYCKIYDEFFSRIERENKYRFKNSKEKDMFLWKFGKSLLNKNIDVRI